MHPSQWKWKIWTEQEANKKRSCAVWFGTWLVGEGAEGWPYLFEIINNNLKWVDDLAGAQYTLINSSGIRRWSPEYPVSDRKGNSCLLDQKKMTQLMPYFLKGFWLSFVLYHFFGLCYATLTINLVRIKSLMNGNDTFEQFWNWQKSLLFSNRFKLI